MNIPQKLGTGAAVFMAVLMLLSVAVAPVAAAAGDITNPGNAPFSPENVPTGETGVSQNIFTQTNDLGVENDAGADDISIRIDVSDLQSRADLSNAQVSVDESSIASVANDGSDTNLATYSDGTIFLSFNADGSTNIVFDSGSVTLENIDTTGTSTANNLDYVIRTDHAKFDPQASDFSADDIATSDSFDLAKIEISDGQGTTKTVASLTEAFNGDPLLTDSADNEIRISGGTYDIDGLTVPNNNVEIKPLDGADVTLANQDGATTIDTNGKNDVTVRGITFDQNDFDDQALDVDQSSAGTTTIVNNTFTNLDFDSPVVNVDEGANRVSLTENTFDGSAQNADAIGFSDAGSGVEVDISNNEFKGLEVAIEGDDDVNPFTIENNVFENNLQHVTDASDLTLNTVLNNNDFSGKYALIRDTGSANDPIQTAIYGEVDEAESDDGIFAESNERIEIAGEHDLDATLDSGAGVSDVTLTGVNENATLTESGATTLIDISSNSLTNVEVSDITLDLDNGGTSAIIAGSNADDGVIVTNTEILNVQGGSNAIDFQGGDAIEDVEITDNTFDSDNSYTAVAFADGVIQNNGQRVLIDGNTIDGASEGVNLNQLDDSSLVIDVQDNEFLNITSAQNTAGVYIDDYDSAGAQVTINGNTFSAGSGENVDGVSIADIAVTNPNEPEDEILIESNTFSGISDGSGAGTALLIGSTTDDIAVDSISENSFDGNAEHFDLTAGGYSNSEISTLIDNNEFGNVVYLSSVSQSTDVTDLELNLLHGTIGGAVADANAADEFVNVGAGVYEESGIATQASGVTIVAVDRSANTVVTSEADSDILTIDHDNVEVDGLTFNPQVDNANSDIVVTGDADNVLIANGTFEGVAGAVDREAVTINDNGDSQTNVQSADISNYGVGVAARSGSTASPVVGSSTITGNDVGIFVGSGVDGGTPTVVQSTLADNRVGVDLASGAQNAVVNFNDITGNSEAGIRAGGEDLTEALANYYGDENAPNVTTATGGDIVVGDTANINEKQYRPWLADSVDSLADSGLVLVTDSANPPSDSVPGSTGDGGNLGGAAGNGATWLIASLDNTEASNINAGDIVLSVNDGPAKLNNINRFTTDADGGTEAVGSASDPIRVSSDPDDTGGANVLDQTIVPQDNTAGDYTVNVFDTGGTADSGSAVQTFSAPVDGVEVTTDTNELVADGNAEATITLQLVDANDEPVARSGVNTAFAIDNKSTAGVEQVSTEASTDANGEAEFVVTADTVGETFTVTGIDTDNDNSGTVSIDTVEQSQANFSVEFVDGPTTITQNESYSATVNVTNTGDAAGTQDITYDLEDETGLSQLSATQEVSLDAGNSTEVTFEVAASDTNGLDTGNYTHVFASDDDELTVDAEVVGPTDSPLEGAAGEFDDDADGTITASELGDAVNAFGQGDLTAAELGDVVNAFGQS